MLLCGLREILTEEQTDLLENVALFSPVAWLD